MEKNTIYIQFYSYCYKATYTLHRYASDQIEEIKRKKEKKNFKDFVRVHTVAPEHNTCMKMNHSITKYWRITCDNNQHIHENTLKRLPAIQSSMFSVRTDTDEQIQTSRHTYTCTRMLHMILRQNKRDEKKTVEHTNERRNTRNSLRR